MRILGCMQITLLSVGKLKEAYYRDAAHEYIKRLQRYVTLDAHEIREERTGKKEPPNLKKEGQRLLQALPHNAFVIALDPAGKSCGSEDLARRLADLGIHGQSRLVFVIGGPFGLAPEVLNKADWRLSLSPMTFPHELAQVILLEQLYRAFTIIRNENYHK